MANEIAKTSKGVFELVMQRVQGYQMSGEIHLPANYSPENALKSAQLQIQSVVDKNGKPALEVCTRDSVANALLDMVVQGLNPAKKQCYFIVRANKLCLDRSYQGNKHVCKTVAGADDVWAEVVYKGDEFQYEIRNGRKFITKHAQKIENVKGDSIIAAYAVVDFKEERPQYTELMTIDEIIQAWKQGPNYKENGNGAHQKFSAEMAKKTVINRACKGYINSSSDKNLLFVKTFNRSEEIQTEEDVEEEIGEQANTEMIDIPLNVIDEGEEQPAEQGPGF
jgi:recombination protein RecT